LVFSLSSHPHSCRPLEKGPRRSASCGPNTPFKRPQGIPPSLFIAFPLEHHGGFCPEKMVDSLASLYVRPRCVLIESFSQVDLWESFSGDRTRHLRGIMIERYSSVSAKGGPRKPKHKYFSICRRIQKAQIGFLRTG